MIYTEVSLFPYPCIEAHFLPWPEMGYFILNVLMVVAIFGCVIWLVKRQERHEEELEREEIAAQAEKDRMEAELAKQQARKESNLRDLLEAEDRALAKAAAKRPEPKRNPTLKEMVVEGNRKRTEQAEAGPSRVAKPSNVAGPSKVAGPSNVAKNEDKKITSKRNESTPQSNKLNNKRAIDQVADSQDDEKDTSSRRVSKRLPKRKKRDTSDEEDAGIVVTTTLPGGLEDIEVKISTPEGLKNRRRKRGAVESDEDGDENGEDAPYSHRRNQGRAVRRRREKSGSEDGQEMATVQDSTSDRDNGQDDNAETNKTQSEIDSDAGKTDLRATPFDKETPDDQESDEGAKSDGGRGSLMTPQQKGKMPANGSRKKGTQTATSAKKALAAAAAVKKHTKAVTSPRARERVWTERNGRTFKIGADGIQRERVDVKVMRHKYNMPADSVHPDRFAMHQVLVEEWVTEERYDELERQKKLGWQPDEEAPHDEAQVVENRANSPDELAQLNNSLYNYVNPRYPTSPAIEAALKASLSGSQKSRFVDPSSLRRPLRAHVQQQALRSTTSASQQQPTTSSTASTSQQHTIWSSSASAVPQEPTWGSTITPFRPGPTFGAYVEDIPSSRTSMSDVNMSEP